MDLLDITDDEDFVEIMKWNAKKRPYISRYGPVQFNKYFDELIEFLKKNE